MPQKPVTISANEFNEKIRNNLRDYYVYQFKQFSNSDASDYRKKGTDQYKPASTFTEEKTRLLAMLKRHPQMEKAEKKGGVFHYSADARALDTNPFWEPYRFCAASPGYIGWFLNLVLFLHPGMQLRGPDGNIEPVFPRSLRSFRPGAAGRLKVVSQENLQSLLDVQNTDPNADRTWNQVCMDRYCAIFRQRINNREMVLEEDPECFGASRELLLRYHLLRFGGSDIQKDQFSNRLDVICSGILRSKRLSQRRDQWRLSRNRLKLSAENSDLRFRFQQMAAYFSQTLPLGFVGHQLLRRGGGGPNLIRFKHNYIIKALNDYNIADLLHAIGQGLWIHMEFRNGTKLRYQQMVCLPLQIRESTQDGRQYLMYYHPGYRSLGSLRLDFIDRFTCGTVEELPYFAQDTALARALLKTVWGCSVPGFAAGNLMHPQGCVHIRLVLRLDRPVTENRLRREARHGRVTAVDKARQTITYEVDVADPVEMIPWIRSFSGRVLELWADDTACHPRQDDPTTALRAYLNQRAALHGDLPERHAFQDAVTFHPLKNLLYPHAYLFNPLCGVAFDTVAQTVYDMMQQPDRRYSPADLTQRLRRMWPSALTLQDQMLENLKKDILMLCSGSDSLGYRLNHVPTAQCTKASQTFWDLIPLSDLEAAYLKGILLHDKARLFLSKQEISQLLSGLEDPVEPVSFSSLYYYDRHCDVTDRYRSDALREHFAALMDSAATGRTLDTVYRSQYGTQTPSLTVIRLEYSSREDRFRALCAGDGGCISFRNLERFTSVTPTERFEDPALLRQLADKDTRENSRVLVLRFTGERNRPERIATEFSPWKKTCTSQQTGGGRVYTMELFYDARDAAEIAVRLLSYGPGIDIVSDSGDTARQMALRRAMPQPCG